MNTFKKTFISDFLAGLTVSFAALSLGAAFGVMSGRGAFAGMIAAAVIPIITSLFGGTRIQASGPTAPMTSVTALIVAYGYDHFAGDRVLAEQFITLVLLLSSVLIILMGIFRLGRFIMMVPQVVVLGFMNGIAILIFKDQIQKILGLGDKTPLEGDFNTNIIIAFGVLLSIYLIPFLLKKLNVSDNIRRLLPSIFLTIVLFTIITSSLSLEIEHVKLGEGISSFGEFTSMLYDFLPTDSHLFSWEVLSHALPLALQLCLLAYLDSLLTSLVIDKMTREQTKHDKELIAQGLANGLAGLLQGIPGAQATIRSVLLVKEGAKTRLAGVLIGVFALLGLLIFNNLISMICSAVFVGVLFKAGLDVLDRDFPKAYWKYKWHTNKNRNIQLGLILLTTIITVVIDLNVAVFVGTVLFYLGRKYMKITDAESDFTEVESEDLAG
jgi:SulP family sulfate permease